MAPHIEKVQLRSAKRRPASDKINDDKKTSTPAVTGVSATNPAAMLESLFATSSSASTNGTTTTNGSSAADSPKRKVSAHAKVEVRPLLHLH